MPNFKTRQWNSKVFNNTVNVPHNMSVCVLHNLWVFLHSLWSETTLDGRLDRCNWSELTKCWLILTCTIWQNIVYLATQRPLKWVYIILAHNWCTVSRTEHNFNNSVVICSPSVHRPRPPTGWRGTPPYACGAHSSQTTPHFSILLISRDTSYIIILYICMYVCVCVHVCVHVCPCMCVCVYMCMCSCSQWKHYIYTYKTLWDCIGTHITPLLIHWDAVYGRHYSMWLHECTMSTNSTVQWETWCSCCAATLVNIQSHSEYRLKEATDPNTIEQA